MNESDDLSDDQIPVSVLLPHSSLLSVYTNDVFLKRSDRMNFDESFSWHQQVIIRDKVIKRW